MFSTDAQRLKDKIFFINLDVLFCFVFSLYQREQNRVNENLWKNSFPFSVTAQYCTVNIFYLNSLNLFKLC